MNKKFKDFLFIIISSSSQKTVILSVSIKKSFSVSVPKSAIAIILLKKDMESKAVTQKKINFREVYVFDMEVLQNIFIQNMREKAEDKMLFGIPFLLCEKNNKINSFASLILNQKNEIEFRIYDDGSLTNEDKALFNNYIKNFLKKKNSANFNNAAQLRQSTDQFIHYLSF